MTIDLVFKSEAFYQKLMECARYDDIRGAINAIRPHEIEGCKNGHYWDIILCTTNYGVYVVDWIGKYLEGREGIHLVDTSYNGCECKLLEYKYLRAASILSANRVELVLKIDGNVVNIIDVEKLLGGYFDDIRKEAVNGLAKIRSENSMLENKIMDLERVVEKQGEEIKRLKDV